MYRSTKPAFNKRLRIRKTTSVMTSDAGYGIQREDVGKTASPVFVFRYNLSFALIVVSHNLMKSKLFVIDVGIRTHLSKVPHGIYVFGVTFLQKPMTLKMGQCSLGRGIHVSLS